MDTATMRRIDRAVGVPACGTLTALRRLGGRTRPYERPQRIAIVKLAELGATVIAVPALRRAVAAVGRDNVHLLVFEENRALLDELDLVPERNVITVATTSPSRTMADLARAVATLRRRRIDAVVDFESFSRVSAVVAALSGARIRVGLHAPFGESGYRGDLLTHRVLYNPHLHASQMFDALVAAALAPPDRLPALEAPTAFDDAPVAMVPPTPDERRRVRRLAGLDDASGPVVLLNANASDLLPLRRWSSERYVALARRLLAQRDDLEVVFTGAPGEAGPIAELVAQVGSPRCHDAAGRTTLRELLVLMDEADVLVTNDSGPGHFAALTSVRAVTLFGPESPAVFGPLDPSARPLWAGLPCSPCVSAYNDRRSTCTDNLCMQAISVDEVVEAVGAALDEPPAHQIG